jgi:hypothetical protein
MNLFVLFGNEAISPEQKKKKKRNGNFALCTTRNDAVSCLFLRVILHHQTKKYIHSLMEYIEY